MVFVPKIYVEYTFKNTDLRHIVTIMKLLS